MLAVLGCAAEAAPDPSGAAGSAGSPSHGGAPGAAGQLGSSGAQSSSGSSAGGVSGNVGASGSPASGGHGGTSESGGMGSSGSSAGGAGGGGSLAPGNDPVPSAGCGKPSNVTNGKKTITSTNQQRTYVIDIPNDYDMNKPYRLFYTSHWISAHSEDVVNQDYYFLKPLVNAANQPAIFVAPQADGATWQEKDHALFDDILAFVKDNLCIDVSRVFATGFSFGGMITYSLSVNHQKDIRAAVGIAPANYNIFVPQKTHEPIAWMQTTGMGDGTCPWVNNAGSMRGAKFIALEHAMDNGCTVPGDIPTWQQGPHTCFDFQGCKAGFPSKACTFDGGHTNIDSDPGSNANWIAQESWNFFKQF